MMHMLQVDELVAQAAQARRPGQSAQAVTVKHPGHLLYPLDGESSADLQVLAAFVPTGMDI